MLDPLSLGWRIGKLTAVRQATTTLEDSPPILERYRVAHRVLQ